MVDWNQEVEEEKLLKKNILKTFYACLVII